MKKIIITNETLTIPKYSPFALGIDIETGGQAFQIIATNSVGMKEHSFIGHPIILADRNEVANGGIIANANFRLNPEDYKIKIPKLVCKNIAKKVDVLSDTKKTLNPKLDELIPLL